MKKLSLYVFLVLMWCNVGFAKLGDVYYCEMDEFAETTYPKSSKYELEKFKFLRKKNILKFSSKGYFGDFQISVLSNVGEYFWGGDEWTRFIFHDGVFVYAQLVNIQKQDNKQNLVISVVATCETF